MMKTSSRRGFSAIRLSKVDKHPSEEMIDNLERFVEWKNGGINETFCTLSTFNSEVSRESRGGKAAHDNEYTELRSRVIDSIVGPATSRVFENHLEPS